MNAQKQMYDLFKVYYAQCPNEQIKYTAQEERDGFLQSWIVMDGIELSHMMYQGKEEFIFMTNRYCPKYGDDTYYFKSFDECKKVWNLDAEQLEKYADKLQMKFDDIDGNELKMGDKVVMLDVDDLEGDYLPKRGDIIEVDGLYDVESNYIGFSGYSFFGHKVLKLN